MSMLKQQLIFENNIISLGWKLNYVANYYSLIANRELARHHNCTRQEFVVLFCLVHGGAMTAQAVSDVCGRPKNTISRAVNKLLDKGMISRTPHPTDQRSGIIHLKAEGREMYERIIGVFAARDQDMTAGLTEGEQKELGRLLTKMIKAFQDRPIGPDEDEL